MKPCLFCRRDPTSWLAKTNGPHARWCAFYCAPAPQPEKPDGTRTEDR